MDGLHTKVTLSNQRRDQFPSGFQILDAFQTKDSSFFVPVEGIPNGFRFEQLIQVTTIVKVPHW